MLRRTDTAVQPIPHSNMHDCMKLFEVYRMQSDCPADTSSASYKHRVMCLAGLA